MTEAEDVGLDRLVDACVKIRDRKAVIADEMNTKLSALDDKLAKFKQILNEHCASTGAESVRTATGTFYRSVHGA